MVQKIDVFFAKLSLLKLMLLAIIINLLISVSFSFIASFLFNDSLNNNVNGFENMTEEIIAVIIIAPIFETLFFQYCIIEFFRKKMNKFYVCLLSSFIFALFHLYNFYYFLFALFTGIVFAYLYLLGKKKNRAIILTIASHSLYNLIIFFLKRI